MHAKSFLQSKTLWFNLLVGAGALFGPGGAFGHVFTPEEVGAVLGVGNIALRLVTDKKLVF